MNKFAKMGAQCISIFNKKPFTKLRVFLFPFAGGNSYTFQFLEQFFDDDIELCYVELPGRGIRMTEPLYTSLDSLVDHLTEGLMPYMDMPYVFFGHSMGALIAYEVIKRLSEMNLELPHKLFISSMSAPHLGLNKGDLHRLPDDEFKSKIAALDGTPQALIDNEELFEILLPIIRADFQMCETYSFNTSQKISIPVVAFGGTEDPIVSREALQRWAELTSESCHAILYPGGHFYFQRNDASELIVKDFGQQLYTIVDRHSA